MTIDINLLVMIVGFGISIFTFYNTQKTNVKEETQERTKMYTKIDSTCSQINEILRSVDKMSDKFDGVSATQLRHDEHINGIDKTLEKHEERLKKLEDKG